MSKLDKLLTAPCAELRSPLIMALRTGSDRGIVCRIQSRPLLISKVPLRSCRNNFHVVLLAFYYVEFRDLSVYPLSRIHGFVTLLLQFRTQDLPLFQHRYMKARKQGVKRRTSFQSFGQLQEVGLRPERQESASGVQPSTRSAPGPRLRVSLCLLLHLMCSETETPGKRRRLRFRDLNSGLAD